MGGMSDRIGRRLPLLAGAIGLAVTSVVFAMSTTLPWLFVARFMQGAADAVTWVVGLALVADLYAEDERGRVMGLVMSGTTVGFLVGPSAGGWLYETGGPRLPYLVVAGLAALCAAGFAWLQPPAHISGSEPVRLLSLLRVRAVAICVATITLGGGALALIEPTLALHLADALDLGPGRIGAVLGGAAVVSAVLHPVMGRLADAGRQRRLMLAGLAGIAVMLPLLALPRTFAGAALLYALFTLPIVAMVTPSLAYMADATAGAGVRSFGVAYGVYNCAWALGLLLGPALGGLAYERLGFARLTLVAAIVLLLATLLLSRVPVPRAEQDGV
jgi:DHA1 family solute carrier family 18 vesicular amine transporter 1/2